MKSRHFIKIAIAQFNPVLADLAENISKHTAIIKQAISEQADLIIFPELSLTGYSLKDATFDVAIDLKNPVLKPFYDLSKNISIAAGIVELSERDELFNTQLFFEEGKLITRHRKVYLPTYGVFEEERYFSSGRRLQSFNSRFGKMGMLICEDIWHPSSAQILALDGASIILVSAAGLTRGLDKAEKPENIRSWEMLIRSMALTTTSYVIFSNRVGVEDGLMFWGGSEIVEPSGNTLVKADYYDETIIFGTIDLFKLRHARINATLLSDENLPLVIDELSRIYKEIRDY